jgi:hypothetical protein
MKNISKPYLEWHTDRSLDVLQRLKGKRHSPGRHVGFYFVGQGEIK